MTTTSANRSQPSPSASACPDVHASVPPPLPAWVPAYLHALGDHCCKLQAARAAGTQLCDIVELRRSHPHFAAEEKRRLDTQPEFLESEAMRRTMTQITFDPHGRPEGRAAGSDRLLIQLMGYYIPGWRPAPRPPRPPTNRQVLAAKQEQSIKDNFRALDIKLDRFGNNLGVVEDTLAILVETNPHLATAFARAEAANTLHPLPKTPAAPSASASASHSHSIPSAQPIKPTPKSPSRPLDKSPAPESAPASASAAASHSTPSNQSNQSTAPTCISSAPDACAPCAHPGVLPSTPREPMTPPQPATQPTRRSIASILATPSQETPAARLARLEAAKKEQAFQELLNLAEQSRRAEWMHDEYRKTIPTGTYPDQELLNTIRAKVCHWSMQAGMNLAAALALHQKRQNPDLILAPVLPPTDLELSIAAEQQLLETKLAETKQEIARLTRAGWYPNDRWRVEQTTLLRQLENCRIPISNGVPFAQAFAQEQATNPEWKPP